MAGQRSQKPAMKLRSQCRMSGKRVLEALEEKESAAVLRILIDRNPKLGVEAEEIAKGLVSSPSAEDVAENVISAIMLIDEDEMAGKAGKHSWGYVEPGEADLQPLEDAMEDIFADMKRRMGLGLSEAAEKMFAIHAKIELFKREQRPIGSYARHYYDLFQLAAQQEVVAMLQSAEYGAIKADYDQISRTHFPKSYFNPEDMSFARSDAIFPPADLAAIISAEYERQCKMLCYGQFPTWAEVQTRFEELRQYL
jgi:hypothetical protein